MDSLFPIDHWLTVRKAWVKHLKAYGPLTTKVAAANIWGEQRPAKETAWPFIKLNPANSEPFSATGLRGSSHLLRTHCYSHGPFTDEVAGICAAVLAAGNEFIIDTLDIRAMQWANTSVIPDGDEADAWHGIVDFNITATLSV